MGSGKLIKRAIKKYGIENFTKEILFDFSTEEEMNAKEKETVVLGENSYNLCEGGKGGFGYINSSEKLVAKRDKKLYKKKGREAADKVLMEKYGEDFKKVISKMADPFRIEPKSSFKFRPLIGDKNPSYGGLSSEHKEKIRIAALKREEQKRKAKLNNQS